MEEAAPAKDKKEIKKQVNKLWEDWTTKGYVPKPGEAALSLVARNAIMNYEKGRLTERKSVWEKAGQSNWGPAKAKYDKATDRKELVNSIASSEKEQQQPEPVTDEVEVTAPSPAPASPVYPDLSSLKNSPPYELLSQNNPFLPAPPKAIQAPQFKVKSGYLEMEESTQKPLLEAVKTLSSVTTSALTDLQRSELWEDSTGARPDKTPETMVLWRDQVIKGLPKPVQTALEDVVNLETQPFYDWKQT
ncbi:hypothetical protein NQZ68_035618 [Dissostichus eleginoides]|nr:hypothetical protein NQZ68_035618 [Dissostichus eleginoides]